MEGVHSYADVVNVNNVNNAIDAIKLSHASQFESAHRPGWLSISSSHRTAHRNAGGQSISHIIQSR